jgi:hypothetical protein
VYFSLRSLHSAPGIRESRKYTTPCSPLEYSFGVEGKTVPFSHGTSVPRTGRVGREARMRHCVATRARRSHAPSFVLFF